MSYTSIVPNFVKRFHLLAGAAMLLPALHPRILADDSIEIRFCEKANASANEESLEVRLTRDGERLAAASARRILPDKFAGELKRLFDSELDATERMEAAENLRGFARDSKSHAVQRMVQRRTETVEAALRGLEHYPGDKTAHALANEVAVRSAIDFESGGREFHGRVVHKTLTVLQSDFPAVHAQIWPVLTRHFFNHNVLVTVSEPMASHIVSRVDDRTEGVSQCVLGAHVTGCQSTRVTTRANILPSSTSARWTIIGDGKTRTDTQAHRHPATVCAIGDHCFRLDRSMNLFDHRVVADPASICVDANNRITGVSTSFDGVPVVRGIVRRIALRQANEKRPQSEAIAASQIRKTALPEFEEQTDELPQKLGRVLARFSEARREFLNRVPTYGHSSTGDHLFFRSNTRSDVNLSASEPPAYPLPHDTLTVQIHESTVNAVIDLAGAFGQRTANDFLKGIDLSGIGQQGIWNILTELRQLLAGERLGRELETRLPTLNPEIVDIIGTILPSAAVFGLGADLELTPASVFRDQEKRTKIMKLVEAIQAGQLPKLNFKDCDPFRVRFDEGEVHLVFDSGPRRNKAPERSIPLRVTVREGKLGLEAIMPPPTSPRHEEMRREIRDLLDDLKGSLRPEIRDHVEDLLRDRYPDELFSLPPNLKLQVVDVHITDGWLNMTLAPR